MKLAKSTLHAVFVAAGFVVLLLLNLTAPSSGAETSHGLDRFESEIIAYENKDKKNPPPQGQTVFIGSSTFTRWETLNKDLRKLHPVNRGFGGSTIAEINHYEKRLMANLHPSRIVFYAGTNDIAEGHTAQQVCDDFKAFVRKAQEDAPGADIYFISMSVAPSRISMQDVFDRGNQLIAEFIKIDPKLHFIDVRSAMRDKNNQLRASYFGPDHLHMTHAGYEAWIPIIERALAN
ncbi:MAG: hypothetical protein JST44_02965 [Cyanobacteria bacterium SZAS LIN-5]|nr:hypothetical protein [Cyanobacteria bacterium SZAS LIN-5]